MQEWLQKCYELDSRMKRFLFKPRKKVVKDWNWKTRVIFFWLSGILGWIGTLMIWNGGKTGYIGEGRNIAAQRFILGAVDPLTGIFAILLCILSIFLINEALSFPEQES